jgi:hypothetical protein
MCNACELGKNKSMNCIFCPIKGGAMKQAKHHDSWAHVVEYIAY